MCVQDNSSSSWALACSLRSSISSFRVKLSVVKRSFGMMEWPARPRCSCFQRHGTVFHHQSQEKREEKKISLTDSRKSSTVHKQSTCANYMYTQHITLGGKLGNRRVFPEILRKDMAEWNSSMGTMTHYNRSLLCLCTSSDTCSATTAKDWVIFCYFIQQRMMSKTCTLQLTVQMQSNHPCHLGWLCYTCPKNELKRKHHQGQGQCRVQSSGALKKKHWAALDKELEVCFI